MGEYNTYIDEYNNDIDHEKNVLVRRTSQQSVKHINQSNQKQSMSQSLIAQVVMIAAVIVIASQTIFKTKSFEIDTIDVKTHQICIELLTYDDNQSIQIKGSQYEMTYDINTDYIVFDHLNASTWYTLSVYDENQDILYQQELKTSAYLPDIQVPKVVIDSFSYQYEASLDQVSVDISLTADEDVTYIGYMFINLDTDETLQKQYFSGESFIIDVHDLDHQKTYQLKIFYVDHDQSEYMIESYKIYF